MQVPELSVYMPMELNQVVRLLSWRMLRFIKKIGSINNNLLFSIHQAVVKTLNIDYTIIE